ncbi:hypothetical protein ABD76_00070, partial [Paenibacillus dendritiformis]
MKNAEILESLNLGSSVAENDQHLADYFVSTGAVVDFVGDRYDIIRGVKGSGKSAILKMVAEHQQTYPSLRDVNFVVATEHSGEPAFKRAFDTLREGGYTEPALVNAWKVYLINFFIDALEGLGATELTVSAIKYSEEQGVRFRSTSLFKKALWSLLRFIHPKSFTLSESGIAAEFPDQPPEFWLRDERVVDFPGMLEKIEAAFNEKGVRCWVLVDRLDAAFQEDYELEKSALRALLLAYKDFMGRAPIRVKLFFRTDLFDLVSTDGGFRELTHVNDRTSPPIIWDSEKLLLMLMERFAFNEPVRDKYGFSRDDTKDEELRQAAFFSIFPQQIDPGSRKPDTWSWVVSRIQDGNYVRTPRDLQALAENAARKQREQLALGGDQDAETLIDSAAVKAGLVQLSEDKVRTSLIAENPHLEAAIRAFEKGKAEHNEKSLKKTPWVGLGR